MTNVGNDDMCVYCKFGLEMDAQQRSHPISRTYVEDMESPVEVRPPTGDRLFIILRVEESGEHVSLTPLGDLRLYLCHGPAIESSVSEPPGVCIVDATNAVNCSIASDTG